MKRRRFYDSGHGLEGLRERGGEIRAQSGKWVEVKTSEGQCAQTQEWLLLSLNRWMEFRFFNWMVEI